jgi:hypothetical protein
MPGVCDVLYMGGDETGPAHYDIVVTEITATGEYGAIAGGQAPAPGNNIGAPDRKIVTGKDGRLWAVSATTPFLANGTPNGRRINGRIPAEALGIG